jgi:hypothetical protein
LLQPLEFLGGLEEEEVGRTPWRRMSDAEGNEGPDRGGDSVDFLGTSLDVSELEVGLRELTTRVRFNAISSWRRRASCVSRAT